MSDSYFSGANIARLTPFWVSDDGGGKIAGSIFSVKQE
jgi:hypothetical protein